MAVIDGNAPGSVTTTVFRDGKPARTYRETPEQFRERLRVGKCDRCGCVDDAVGTRRHTCKFVRAGYFSAGSYQSGVDAWFSDRPTYSRRDAHAAVEGEDA